MSKRYSSLQGLNLADKSTDGSKTIEILVGLDYYFEFITGEVIKDKLSEQVALKSSFGYIMTEQYKNHSTVNFNETHFLKIHTAYRKSETQDPGPYEYPEPYEYPGPYEDPGP